MSTKDLKNEFIQLLENEVSELDIKEQQTRSLEIIAQFLIYGTTIGAFSGLWKVIELWVKRYANASLKISYKKQDGSIIDVEYTNLTKEEVKSIIEENPCDTKTPLKITLQTK